MSYTEQFKMAMQNEKMQKLLKEKAGGVPDYCSDDATGNWISEVNATLDFFSLKNVYFSEASPYTMVNLVARKIANQPLTIRRELLQGDEIVKVPAERNAVMDVMNKPNENEPGTSFVYKVASELTLMGNAIIWRLRFHRQMILIPTEIVTIELNTDGSIKYYQVNFASAMEFQQVYNGYMRIDPEDIIHIRLPHLNSMYWGLSPFIPIRKSMLFDKYTKEFLLNFYLKQANPGPVLEMDNTANEKNAMRLLKSMEVSWTGRRNQRRTMILPKGVKAKSLQQTLAEQQLKDHLLINRDDIRGALAVPPHELGIQSSGSIGSEETKAALKNFYEQTIKPFGTLISEGLSEGFRKELGPKTYIEFDYSDVSILQADESEKADVAIKKMNFMTINEVRSEMYDLPPVPGGDFIRGAQQQSPFGQLNMENPIQVKPDEPLALPGPDDSQELEKPKPELRTQAFLEKHSGWWTKRKAKEDNELDTAERQIFRTMLDIYSKQAPIAIEEFKKIFSSRMKQEGFFPDEERLRAALNKAFGEFSKQYEDEAVPVIMGSGEVGYDIQLEVPFNLPSQNEIQAIGARNAQDRRQTLASRALTNFEGFNGTTTDQIMGVVEKGIRQSKTLDEVARDIREYFGERAPNRAKTIARTETLLAVSLGQKAAENDAASAVPGLKKVWITAGDERVRDSHVSLDGETTAVGTDFVSGDGNNLEFPRDPRAPADETINCFVYDTNIEMPSCVNAIRSFHEGDIVTVKLKSGSFLKATPNHPVLTPHGWTAIGKLKKGNKLIKAGLRNHVDSMNGNIKGMPSQIGKIFDSFSDSFQGVRKAGAVVDFHGDRPTGDVDIVGADSLLHDGRISIGGKPVKDFTLHNAAFGKSLFFGDGAFAESFKRIAPSHGVIGSFDLFKALSRIHGFPLDEFGLTSAALSKTAPVKFSADRNSGPAGDIADLAYALFFNEMHSDEVIDISVGDFSGHVYNLHTNHGWYIANGVVAHNCRCTWLIVPPDEQLDIPASVGRSAR